MFQGISEKEIRDILKAQQIENEQLVCALHEIFSNYSKTIEHEMDFKIQQSQHR